MKNLLTKTWLRIRWYLWEAVPLFLIGTALLFVLDRTGALQVIVRAGQPIVTGLLGLPADTAQVFVMGFLRRDYGAAGLFQMAHAGRLTGAQSVVALTVFPFAEKTSRKPRAGLRQELPALQVGVPGLTRTVP
jgi:ferrous iron transport protein B